MQKAMVPLGFMGLSTGKFSSTQVACKNEKPNFLYKTVLKKRGGMQMEKRSNKSYTYVQRSIGPIIIGAFVSGMGNGSVFGAAAMCWMGRGMFAEWGGGGLTAYDPSTFNGFMTFWMLGFGLAFAIMFTIALKKHYALETAQGAHGTRQSL